MKVKTFFSSDCVPIFYKLLLRLESNVGFPHVGRQGPQMGRGTHE